MAKLTSPITVDVGQDPGLQIGSNGRINNVVESYIIGPTGANTFVTEIINNFINNYVPPAGNNNEIQINESGKLYADPQLTFDPSTDTLRTTNVIADNISGQLTSSAQPNITTVGTLDHLNITNSIIANGFYYSNGMPVGNAVNDFNRGVYFGSETVSTSVSLVDSVSLTGNTAVRWNISSFDVLNSKYKTATIDSLNDGTEVYYNEFSVIKTDNTSNIIQFSSNISAGNINLWAVGDSDEVNEHLNEQF